MATCTKSHIDKYFYICKRRTKDTHHRGSSDQALRMRMGWCSLSASPKDRNMEHAIHYYYLSESRGRY